MSALTNNQRWTLVLASTGSFLVLLDLFAVSTALPTLRVALHASISTLDWTVNAYTLTFAVFLMTAATLGDRWGRRRVYTGGLVLFTLASAACALATSAGTLIAARAVQGVGAAVLLPLALGLLNAAFPAQRRGWAMGVYGAVTGLGSVLGPVAGGVITQWLSWSWIFWVNVPIGLATAVAVLLRVREGRGAGRALDPRGLILGCLAALALVWGAVRAADTGWGDPLVLGALVAGAALVAGLLAWERRAATPMLPLRLFAERAFAASCAAMGLAAAAAAAVAFFTAQFLHDAGGYGPLTTGLRLLPIGVVPLALGTWSGTLADRVHPRRLILAGLVCQTAGIALLAALARLTVPYPVLAGALLIVGLGITLSVPALTKSVVGTVAPTDIGTASGIFSTVRQLGSAFGIALTSSAFTVAGGYHSAGAVSAGYQGAMLVAAVLSAASALAITALRRPSQFVDGRTNIERAADNGVTSTR